MKTRLLLPMLLCAGSVCAQITITKSEMPVANDTIRYSSVLPFVNVDSTGAGASWDFSNLQADAQDLYRYQNALQTPYFLYFPTLFGIKVADSLGAGPLTFKNIYSFFKSTNTKFTAEGTGFQYIAGIALALASDYSDPDEIYQFPLTYPDRDSTTFRVETVLPTFGSYLQAGYRINTVDGWGNITTPYGTFNSIRVKSEIFEIDSIISPLGTFGFPMNRIEYKWLAKGERIPILQVDGQDLFGQFVPTAVKYRDRYRAEVFRDMTLFSANKTKVATADTVTFTDQSFLAASWKWTITPSTVTYVSGTNSTSKNPKVKFNTPGLYTVKLLATYSGGSDDTTRTNYIDAGIGPVAGFTASKINPGTGEAVSLIDESTGSASWKWNISPATFDYTAGTGATSSNPQVIFNSPGYYSVSQQVSNSYGTDVSVLNNYIIVSSTGLPEIGTGGLKVYPNPATDILSIILPNAGGLQGIYLHDITGKKILLSPDFESDNELAVSLPEGLEGIYLLEVLTDKGRFVSRVQVIGK